MIIDFNIFNRKKSDDNFVTLPNCDSSIEFFQEIKNLSEKYWEETEPSPNLFGYQVQQNTKWNKGLSEIELEDFQFQLNIKFCEELKNFYRIMNGTDNLGINLFGSKENEPAFGLIFYSYPNDIKAIKDNIDWIYESNNIDSKKVDSENIPKIVPIIGHRFIALDENNQILSMYGNDILFYADNIGKLLANDIFDLITNVTEFESNPNFAKPVKFWLDF